MTISMNSAASNALSQATQMMGAKGNAASSELKDAAASKDMKRVDQAAEDFEAVFITEMLKPIFNMVEVDETFGGGKGEEVFGDFMVQEYGKMIAKQGGIGLSAQIKAEMIKMQAANATPVQPQ